MMSHKVAILHILVGGLLTCFVGVAFAAGTSGLSDVPLLALLLLVPLATLIGGIGLLRRRYWGYIAVMILSGMWILVFPVGTALGAFSLWVLIKEPMLPPASKKLRSEGAEVSPPSPPRPEPAEAAGP